MEKVVLSRKNIEVIHNTEKNYLYLNWKGFQLEDDIYEAGEQVLQIFRGLDCSKVLNDNREVVGPWNKASEWTQSYWFPEMIKAGLNQFAWVFPDNIFAELSAQKAMPNTELIHKFKSYEKAEQWLEGTYAVAD